MSPRLLAAIVIAVLSGAALGQTPLGTAFTYQGRLEDAGSPAGGVHDLRFRLYDALSGGAQLGATVCFNNVSVTDGLFTVSLDFGAQFAGDVRFLEIDVRADSGRDCTNSAGFVALNPRQALMAAPNALNADLIDGLDSTAFLQSIPVPLSLSGTSAAHIIRGENTSTASGVSGVYGATTATNGVNFGVFGRSASTSGQGVTGVASASSGATFGVYGENASTAGTSIYGLATAATGATRGVYGQSDSSSGRGVFGYAAAATGTTYGGRFVSDSAAGQGVLGYATAPTGTTYGVRGVSDSTEGRAVFGEATAATGFTYGGRFESASTLGRGVYGEATAATGETFGGRFHSASSEGEGVYGVASATSGNTAGVRGESVSDDYPAAGVKGVSSGAGGTGVVGVNTSTTTTGFTYGVRGHSVNGIGVHGAASGTSAVNYGVSGTSGSSSGRGVYGTMSVGTGITYGVYGHNAGHDGIGVYGVETSFDPVYGVLGEANGPGANGVYALGNMGASGTKSFRIDHPDDPDNKYLLHYAAESPEVINFYCETVTLDERGGAVVELPAYFAKINIRPRYQLTAVGAPMPMLHVAEKISESALSAGANAEPGEAAPVCSFRIAGGAPGGEVSWEVKALRNDRWVQQRGAPVEIEKKRLEKGTYQHPELYGQPNEKGMNYDAERERPSPPSTAAEHAPVNHESEIE